MGIPEMSYDQKYYQKKWGLVQDEANGKKVIYDEKKSRIFQFKVGYMIYPMPEK